MLVTAKIQQAPPDHRGGYTLEKREVQATSADYDEAMAQCRAQVPEGWRLLYVMVDRD